MNRKFYTLLVTCLVVTLISGAIRGRMDQRWGPTPEMLAAADRVVAIPTDLGPWQAVTRDHLNADAAAMLRCTGNIFRVYVHQPTGKQVTVVFMVGPSGPLVMHTPDACYRSGNYSQHQSRAKRQIIDRQGQPHEFLVTTFQENAAGNRLLRVYYSWNQSGEWKAPLAARTAFAGVPMLYKIQVATHDIADIDAGEMFLRDALPELRTVCSPTDCDREAGSRASFSTWP
jgi:hypothetical protein